MIRALGAIVLAMASVALPRGACAAVQQRRDPALLAALRSDPQLRACRCIVSASWLDESYPRVTVDVARWRTLDAAARAKFGARALEIAETTYLVENAATDQYEQIFIVDRGGKVVYSFHPTSR